MEALFLIAGLAWLGLAAYYRGTDSRPHLDDEPRRAI